MPDNPNENHETQLRIVKTVGDRIQEGEKSIVGVMIRSNIWEGSQKIPPEGVSGLRKGVSITDACIGWDTTVFVLRDLAAAVRERRVG